MRYETLRAFRLVASEGVQQPQWVFQPPRTDPEVPSETRV